MLAIATSFVPALKKWHMAIFQTSLSILFGFGGGAFGFFFGSQVPCNGAFCNLGAALLLCIVGLVLGITLSALLLSTIKTKKNTAQYWSFFTLNLCINLGIIAVVYAILSLQHIALFPALFYWYIPPF